VTRVIEKHAITHVIHLAAESHVDRSIHGPEDFIQTNIVGTFHLLEEARGYRQDLPAERKADFRFLHVSTDEVFGSLGPTGYFTEETPYAPNSPYSASKASSDHFVRAYFHTYGLPTVITNCSNNYGPYQFPEKLIPLMILNALSGKSLPVYGDGSNVRDWIYVDDHCRGVKLAFGPWMRLDGPPGAPLGVTYSGSYFGTIDPKFYRIDADPFYAALDNPPDLSRTHVLAVSATYIQGIYSGPYAEAFRDKTPTDVLGGTIYVYDLRNVNAPP